MKTLSDQPLCYEIEQKEMLEHQRLDVTFFHPKFVEAEGLLNNSRYPSKKLANMAKLIKDGPHHTPKFVQDGVIFLQKGDVTEGEINFERPKKVTLEFHKQNPKTQAHPGDILLRKIGVGPREAAVVPERSPALHIFVTLALIRLKKEYSPQYVEIFLNSSLGRTQTERRNKGIGSPCLHLEDIKEIVVPNPPKSVQEMVVKTITDARMNKRRNLIEINDLRNHLELFFLREFDLIYPQNKEEMVFTTNLDERFDPHFYHPKFDRITNALKKGRFKLSKLKEVVTFSNEQINPQEYPDKLFKYIQIQNIDEANHKISSYTSVSGKKAPGRARMLIKGGDILLPTLGGSLKSIAIVPKEFDGEVATNGFAILRVHSEQMRRYVFFYLATKIAQMQLEQLLSGAIMPSVNKSELKNILIPVPDHLTLEKIDSLILEINNRIIRLQREADVNLAKAKEKVEQLILGN